MFKNYFTLLLLALLLTQCEKEKTTNNGLFSSDAGEKNTFDSIKVEIDSMDFSLNPSVRDSALLNNPEGTQRTDPSNSPANVQMPQTPAPPQYAYLQNNEGDYIFFYKLEPNKNYNLKMRVKNTQTIKVQGQSQTAVDEESMKLVFRVNDLNQGVYDMSVRFTELGQKSTLPGGQRVSLNTSSSRPSEEMLKMAYDIKKAQVEAGSFNVKMTQLGQIVDVDGLDKMRQAVRAKVKPQLKNEEEIKAFDQLLGYSLSKQALAAQLGELLIEFKQEPLKRNEKWNDNQDINEKGFNGNMNLSTTLANVNTKEIRFKINGSQNISGSQSKDGVTESMKTNGSINGNLYLDADSGWPIRASYTNRKTTTNKATKDGETFSQTVTEIKETTIS